MAAADGDPMQINDQYQDILGGAGPQPDFEAMHHQVQGLAEQLRRCANLPTVQGPAAIAQIIINHMDERFNQVNTQINQVNTQMNTRFDEVQQRLDASEQNAVARVQNSLLNDRNERLTPLVDPLTNDPITNFPTTPAHIDGLNIGALNPLLIALRKSLAGNIARKRQRLRIAIGLTPMRRTTTETGA
ncbi:hypothetical protein EV356DRAFT_536941 [Viridothelium virens]|uniref:Uncharacterized protein n=1 Tax=Viridothelium virens TaxID=1048519 RepID=A0A6A6GVE2_VIRVR|nr:hypothetical protein EV356DRAFT_536941 [Viridothelium virens]